MIFYLNQKIANCNSYSKTILHQINISKMLLNKFHKEILNELIAIAYFYTWKTVLGIINAPQSIQR